MGIKILDCTLRDGAYVVDSFFGEDTIKGIIKELTNSGLEIIECGWLKNNESSLGKVLFSTPSELKQYLPFKKSKLALMFDLGRYNIETLGYNNGIIDIIRIAFHKNNLEDVPSVSEKVKSMGYKLFLQPSNIKEYNEDEIIKLCKMANSLNSDALYIVDSFGSMFPEDLNKIMPIFDSEIKKEMSIGFHSHNNLQLSLGLSIQFINYLNHRDIIVDSSVCGLGRGAGNTKTELLVEYLNRNCNKGYKSNYLWNLIETYISPLYDRYNWEYTPQKGLRGIKGIHPKEQINNYCQAKHDLQF